MKTHELKTWPKHFNAIFEGDKRFEFRIDDRGFQVDDFLHLREYVPSLMYGVTAGGDYTGREIMCQVTYILNSTEEQPEFVPDNWVIMSIKVITITSKSLGTQHVKY